MKKFWLSLTVSIMALAGLSGCSPITVLNPKGPQAEIQSDTIIFSMYVMAGILIIVYALFIYMIVKYRATNQPVQYDPPYIKGNKWLEIIWTAIPIIIVIVLSVVTVKTTFQVESTPAGYEDEEPLVIYAASSNWKWHFSYPEQGIETVNYVNIPTDREIEFRLYTYGPITSLWIPQLAGQKYAMSDMVTTLRLAADEEGEYHGRNANFSGEGFAQMDFICEAMTEEDFNDWVDEVQATADPLTEEEFDKLLDTEYMGIATYSSTHLEFRPAPVWPFHQPEEDEDGGTGTGGHNH
ncbi:MULTISPECIES: cytochrome aa3 quinol oxidase subunit II [Bacillaceae]|uniref:cytochrome aa3 quinol oxidase subunit II n=1 Tax=Bacillaceae TaxID=186817 RepID=UPI00069FE0CC|nr:cytochrome aa3 quinol oxidase subunit II [Bacillus sp. FJAT-27916]